MPNYGNIHYNNKKIPNLHILSYTDLSVLDLQQNDWTTNLKKNEVASVTQKIRYMDHGTFHSTLEAAVQMAWSVFVS